MSRDKFRRKIARLLSRVDVQVGGERPWDPRIHNENFYGRVMAEGSLGLGESYMDSWWDCDRLDEFFCRILRADLDTKVKQWLHISDVLQAKLFNLQKPSRAFEIGRRHYDVGNDLYRCMLDSHLIYSCAYWKNAASLEEAQEAKLDLICRKLDLQPGMRVLDIGCGWGGTARFAAERYQVEVTGLTVSEKQAKFADKCCRGFPVTIHLQDYRDLQGTFDRVLSVGMFEHVGHKNYPTYMSVVKNHLREDGLFLLQTIGRNHSGTTTDRWISRYIFPNSMLPSAKQICTAIEGLFVIEDWQSLGGHYDKTLMSWFRNFRGNWDCLRNTYGERFYRMWQYYLLSSAGAFRARKNQLWQLVLSPRGVQGDYIAPR